MMNKSIEDIPEGLIAKGLSPDSAFSILALFGLENIELLDAWLKNKGLKDGAGEIRHALNKGASRIAEAHRIASIFPLPVPYLANDRSLSPGVVPQNLLQEANSKFVPIKIPDNRIKIEEFIAWMQKGIAAGQLKYNTPGAALHFVQEGLLLITPKIFRDFLQLETNDVQYSPTTKAKVTRLQHLLQQSGHISKSNSKSYLHCYQIIGAKKIMKSHVTGFLMTKPSHFFNPVPSVNPALYRS